MFCNILTKNEKEKQGKGGGPYTNEAVGAENYGTISYVAESPHEKGVIWVGTDDGLIQITEDGGHNWRKVDKISGVPNRTYVNSVYTSHHDENVIYVAFNNHKAGDFKPTSMGPSDFILSTTPPTSTPPPRSARTSLK